jgi:hypothetical protein
MNNRGIFVLFPAGTRDFLFFKTSELTLQITPFPVQWVLGALSVSKVAGDNFNLTFTTLLYFLYYLFILLRCVLLFLLGICRGQVCEMLLQYYSNLTSVI